MENSNHNRLGTDRKRSAETRAGQADDQGGQRGGRQRH